MVVEILLYILQHYWHESKERLNCLKPTACGRKACCLALHRVLFSVYGAVVVVVVVVVVACSSTSSDCRTDVKYSSTASTNASASCNKADRMLRAASQLSGIGTNGVDDASGSMARGVTCVPGSVTTPPPPLNVLDGR